MDMDMVRLGVELSELVYPGCDLPFPLEKIMTLGGGAYLNPFFVASKDTENLYIAIRGAAEPNDFMLCADFEREDFAGGKAHKGILKGARWIISNLRNYIDSCKGKILCCGHSLGGATAGMICAILTLEEKRSNVFSVSLAPFPILSANLANQLANNSVSFVFRNDLVPRLSAHNLSLLIHSFIPPGMNAQQVGLMIQPMLQQIFTGILATNNFTTFPTNPVDQTQISNVINTLINIADNASTIEEFELPGKSYYLDFDADGLPLCKPYTDAQKAVNFLTIFTSITDHSGTFYEDTIYGIDELESN
ncbi:Lipase family protein [Histomonas meleagridis]|uniref:Lipase family protein n=1 Tax=Histomonas meleagridis TaxID=135588 RepID=UPI00355A1CF8|nr:Lipase family protein [Histomonas meleagridis]KAH0802516.1 Lipase family protein [Histomonas meleagridis]